MASYRCPLCGKTMNRDLAVFMDHTNQHVIDKIKVAHPEWVTADGGCKPCVEYYQSQLSGDFSDRNIGPGERRKRVFLGWIMLMAGLFGAVIMIQLHVPPLGRLSLFFPFFLSAFGFIQACEKTCAWLALSGQKNMDSGVSKIKDHEVSGILRRRGLIIFLKSVVAAVVLTAIFSFIR